MTSHVVLDFRNPTIEDVGEYVCFVRSRDIGENDLQNTTTYLYVGKCSHVAACFTHVVSIDLVVVVLLFLLLLFLLLLSSLLLLLSVCGSI